MLGKHVTPNGVLQLPFKREWIAKFLVVFVGCEPVNPKMN